MITKTERRRRWSTAEKIRLVERTKEPGMSVFLVAREEGIAANMLFRWLRLTEDGGLSAVSSEETVVPFSEVRALQRVRELERCPGRKALECEILQEVIAYGKEKKWLALSAHCLHWQIPSEDSVPSDESSSFNRASAERTPSHLARR